MSVYKGTVIIAIKAYNILPPVFDPYNDTTIPEEQGEGSFVMSLVARDDDGVIRGYEIIEQPHDFFEISYESGMYRFNPNKCLFALLKARCLFSRNNIILTCQPLYFPSALQKGTR